MMIHIRPLTWHWNEWTRRYRENTKQMQEIIRTDGPVAGSTVLGRFNRETDTWLRGLLPDQQEDVIALLRAEHDLLWDTINPGKGPKPAIGSEAFTDFRERFYEALPLVLAVERVRFTGAARLREHYGQLEGYAHERSWLP